MWWLGEGWSRPGVPDSLARLMHERTSVEGLVAYADAGRANSRKSRAVTGGALIYGGVILFGVSRTQDNVWLSSAEAEYVAAGGAVNEVRFVRGFLEFVQPDKEEHVYCEVLSQPGCRSVGQQLAK